MVVLTLRALPPSPALQEILALLEGVDLHRDDWMRVRDHVNRTCYNGETVRSHDDCVLAFIRCVCVCVYVYVCVGVSIIKFRYARYTCGTLPLLFPLKNSGSARTSISWMFS